MTTQEAFEFIHNFHHHANADVVAAIDYLMSKSYARELSEVERADLSSSLIAIKWGYDGISFTPDEAPCYLKTHPGFLADVILWAGWQFVVEERTKCQKIEAAL